MSTEQHEVGRKVLGNTAFALLDTILSKLGTTLAFVLLVRLLGSDDIAAVGIASGYLVVLGFLDFAPIRVLIRDYPRLAADRHARDGLLTALFSFWCLQSATMLVVSAGLQLYVFPSLALPGISFLFLGMTVDFVFLTFQDWLRVVFYADFRQSVATGLGFTVGLMRVATYAVLLLSPSLATYAWILIATSALGGLIWAGTFLKLVGYRPVFDWRTPRVLLDSLHSYGFWEHSNHVVIDTLFTSDTVILSWFALTSDLGVIGSYTIALRFTSLLFLVPRQIQNSLQLALANYTEEARRRAAINSCLKIGGLVALAQFAGVVVLGRPMLRLLFGDVPPEVFTFTLILAAGVSIMSLAFPLIGVLNNFGTLRHVFLAAFLPSLFVGLAIYIVAAISWGAIGVAWANIAVYAMLAASLVRYTVRYHPIRIEPGWLSPSERQFLSRVLRRGD
jgi:O-antigen/teichoic acid export membrane protein